MSALENWQERSVGICRMKLPEVEEMLDGLLSLKAEVDETVKTLQVRKSALKDFEIRDLENKLRELKLQGKDT